MSSSLPIPIFSYFPFSLFPYQTKKNRSTPCPTVPTAASSSLHQQIWSMHWQIRRAARPHLFWAPFSLVFSGFVKPKSAAWLHWSTASEFLASIATTDDASTAPVAVPKLHHAPLLSLIITANYTSRSPPRVAPLAVQLVQSCTWWRWGRREGTQGRWVFQILDLPSLLIFFCFRLNRADPLKAWSLKWVF